MSQETAVKFANEAFYAAFTNRDAEAMDAVWSELDAVSCIHPGWPPLTGRAAVMQSWHDILANPDAPAITCGQETAYVAGEMAYVICAEFLDGGQLVATNIFVREAGTWKLVHHQAAPAPADPAAQKPPAKAPTLQ